jgi:outer membrane receptor protein involved in Fe transport
LTLRLAALPVAGALLLALPLHAQTPPAASAGPKIAEETIALSPFQVRSDKDNGYIANDVISGGRISMNLMQSPSDITVLTRDFMNDIGALTTDEAAIWLTNSAVTPPTDHRDFGNTVTFRGLPTGNNTRNYFLYSTSTEEYIVDRLEGARGPNSIIYGDSASGGVVNIVTKRARLYDAASTKFLVDSEGSVRGSLDINRRLTPTSAVRLNAFDHEGRKWIDRYKEKRRGVDLTGTLRPMRGMELRFEGELGQTKQSAYGYVYTDTSSLWDGTTSVNAPLTANPATATGISRFTTDKLVVDPSGAVTNFRNFARTNGTGLTLAEGYRAFPNFPVLPSRGFRITADDGTVSQRWQNAYVSAEKKWDSGFVVELAAGRHELVREAVNVQNNNTYLDVNRVLPSGFANPNYGKRFSENAYNFARTPEYKNEARIAAAYPWITKWVSQTFSVVAQRRTNRFTPKSWQLARTKDPTAVISPNLNDASNQIAFWRYWDQPAAPLVLPQNGNGYEFTRYYTRDTYRFNTLNSLQFNDSISMLHDQLVVVGGVRFDRYLVNSRTGLYNANGYRAGERLTEQRVSPHTKSVATSYFPIPALGVYLNYSQGFAPQSDENPWLGTRGPVFSTAATQRSGGVRFRLLDGKFVGSLGYYSTVEAGRLTSLSILTTINQLWTDLGRSDRLLPTATTVVDDTLDYKGRGYEFDLTGNVGQQLRLKFNFALPQTEQVSQWPQTLEYFAANLPAWQAGAADPANPNRVRITNSIASLSNTLSSATVGRALNGTYKWRANVFATWQVPRVKGLSVGGGANLFGHRLIGNPTGQPFTYIYAKEYFTVSALARYSFQLFNRRTELTLNISNLFDYDDPVFNSTSSYRGTTYRNGYTFIEPRKAMLTMTVPF